MSTFVAVRIFIFKLHFFIKNVHVVAQLIDGYHPLKVSKARQCSYPRDKRDAAGQRAQSLIDNNEKIIIFYILQRKSGGSHAIDSILIF